MEHDIIAKEEVVKRQTPFSFNIVEEKDLPPITPEQRAALIKLVRKGAIPFAPKLMARANITPEECATPYARFREEIYQELKNRGYNVTDWQSKLREISPVDAYIMDVIDLGRSYGYPRNIIMNRITTSERFHEMIDLIKKGGKAVKVTAEDLRFIAEGEV